MRSSMQLPAHLAEHVGTAGKLALLLALLAAGVLAASFARTLLNVQRIQRRLAAVPAPAPPTAPLQRWLHEWLGPIVPLYKNTPWEVMRQWVAESPPIVHIRILLRPCVIVGSAAGLKRIFQVRADGPSCEPKPETALQCRARDCVVLPGTPPSASFTSHELAAQL